MLGPLVIFSIVSLASTAEGKDNQTCTQNGKVYGMGDIVSMDSCKLCACSNTETIDCMNIACQHKKKGYDCYYKGKIYNKGEHFTDDCNVCICISTNKTICTEKSCKHSSIQNSREGDHDTCYCYGIKSNIGEHITRVDYSSCICEGVNAFTCKERWFTGAAAIDNLTCTQNRKTYEVGEVVSMNSCKLCACTNIETIECINIECQRRKEGYDCDYKGNIYRKNEQFTDDCNLCFCIGTNKTICTEKSCKQPSIKNSREGDNDTCYCYRKTINRGNNFTRVDGTICICEGVNAFTCKERWFSGVPRDKDTCSPGGRLMIKARPGKIDRENCRKCMCLSEMRFHCENVKCIPSDGTERVRLKGSCYYKGKLYKKDDAIRHDCNVCTCLGNDEVTCTQWSCGLQDMSANNDNKVVGKDCKFSGKTFPKGKTFARGCDICYCSISGDVDCLLRPCPTYTRLLRIEDSCEYNGFFMPKGQTFIDKDCQSCTCVGNDHWNCEKVSCSIWFLSIPNYYKNLAGSCVTDGNAYKISDDYTNVAGNVTTLARKWLLIV